MTDKAVIASRERMPAFSSLQASDPQLISQIPLCDDNRYMRQDQPCYTLVYAPAGAPLIDRVMSGILQNNDPPIPESSVRGFADASEIDPYLLSNPQTVLAAVVFTLSDPQTPATMSFSLQTNTSVQWFKGEWQDPNTYVQLPLQVAVEREITRVLTGGTTNYTWDVSIAEFPHPAATSSSMAGAIAPTFFFASIMFQFVLLLHDVVAEKESGVRRAMSTMGLKNAPFWSSWIIFQIVLAVVEAFLLVAFSYAFQFELFLNNAFSVTCILLLMVSLAMVSFGFFVAAFLRKASAAVPVGFFVFVVAWVLLIVVAFGFPYAPTYGDGAIFIFSMFPWTLLGKGIQDLAEASTSPGAQQGGYGITWDTRFSYCHAETPSPATVSQLAEAGQYWQDDCVMPLGEMYRALTIQMFMYMSLALYLDAVLPDENGVKRPMWFFVLPSYWFPSRKKDTRACVKALQTAKDDDSRANVDTDVETEGIAMRDSCQKFIDGSEGATDDDSTPAIQVFGLRKEYRRGGRIFRRKSPFVAVKGTWLGVRYGECFCLLGPNGAGKSTTIHCLTGVLPPSSGDAIVCGHSTVSAGGMDKIRPMMGVCPQFDILWNELTGVEHLVLFAAIKGLPAHSHKSEASHLLEEVKLTEAGKIRAGSYSGGMRRRLSVAMSFIGDPVVVYLDEPTTGLDPISRRHLWELIERSKKNRAIVLTTHSMEEADVLGDRIGIMARGQLRCIGTSLRLKSKFGSGYRVSVRIGKEEDEEQRKKICALFSKRFHIKPADETKDYVHFLVPPEHEDALPLVLASLPRGAVQLRQSPLEEVFLTVTKKAELEVAEAEGKTEVLILDSGEALEVPFGADLIQAPDGTMYRIRWVQDENGELRLRDYWVD